jgi:multidrug transporter EmrE-like cation transporter
MNRYLPLILAGVLLNGLAQIFLKQGMRTVGSFSLTLESLPAVGGKVALNSHILLGLACYGVSVLVWLIVLSRVEVSFAYPLLSVAYIVVALAGRTLFDETISLARWVGILVICFGVFLMTRTG